GASSGDANSLYFSAGPARGTHGLFGSLSVADAGSNRQFNVADGALGMRGANNGQSEKIWSTEAEPDRMDDRAEGFDQMFSRFELKTERRETQATPTAPKTPPLNGRRTDALAKRGACRTDQAHRP